MCVCVYVFYFSFISEKSALPFSLSSPSNTSNAKLCPSFVGRSASCKSNDVLTWILNRKLLLYLKSHYFFFISNKHGNVNFGDDATRGIRVAFLMPTDNFIIREIISMFLFSFALIFNVFHFTCLKVWRLWSMSTEENAHLLGPTSEMSHTDKISTLSAPKLTTDTQVICAVDFFQWEFNFNDSKNVFAGMNELRFWNMNCVWESDKIIVTCNF